MVCDDAAKYVEHINDAKNIISLSFSIYVMLLSVYRNMGT